jgi:hypothetical protein
MATYYERNKEEILAKNKEKKEQTKQYFKEYYQKNKEAILAKNKEKKEQNKQYFKEYYQKNKEKIKEYNAEYNEKNKEKSKAYQAEYYQKKKQAILARVTENEKTKSTGVDKTSSTPAQEKNRQRARKYYYDVVKPKREGKAVVEKPKQSLKEQRQKWNKTAYEKRKEKLRTKSESLILLPPPQFMLDDAEMEVSQDIIPPPVEFL